MRYPLFVFILAIGSVNSAPGVSENRGFWQTKWWEVATSFFRGFMGYPFHPLAPKAPPSVRRNYSTSGQQNSSNSQRVTLHASNSTSNGETNSNIFSFIETTGPNGTTVKRIGDDSTAKTPPTRIPMTTPREDAYEALRKRIRDDVEAALRLTDSVPNALPPDFKYKMKQLLDTHQASTSTPPTTTTFPNAFHPNFKNAMLERMTGTTTSTTKAPDVENLSFVRRIWHGFTGIFQGRQKKSDLTKFFQVLKRFLPRQSRSAEITNSFPTSTTTTSAAETEVTERENSTRQIEDEEATTFRRTAPPPPVATENILTSNISTSTTSNLTPPPEIIFRSASERPTQTYPGPIGPAEGVFEPEDVGNTPVGTVSREDSSETSAEIALATLLSTQNTPTELPQPFSTHEGAPPGLVFPPRRPFPDNFYQTAPNAVVQPWWKETESEVAVTEKIEEIEFSTKTTTELVETTTTETTTVRSSSTAGTTPTIVTFIASSLEPTTRKLALEVTTKAPRPSYNTTLVKTPDSVVATISNTKNETVKTTVLGKKQKNDLKPIRSPRPPSRLDARRRLAQLFAKAGLPRQGFLPFLLYLLDHATEFDSIGSLDKTDVPDNLRDLLDTAAFGSFYDMLGVLGELVTNTFVYFSRTLLDSLPPELRVYFGEDAIIRLLQPYLSDFYYEHAGPGCAISDNETDAEIILASDSCLRQLPTFRQGPPIVIVLLLIIFNIIVIGGGGNGDIDIDVDNSAQGGDGGDGGDSTNTIVNNNDNTDTLMQTITNTNPVNVMVDTVNSDESTDTLTNTQALIFFPQLILLALIGLGGLGRGGYLGGGFGGGGYGGFPPGGYPGGYPPGGYHPPGGYLPVYPQEGGKKKPDKIIVVRDIIRKPIHPKKYKHHHHHLHNFVDDEQEYEEIPAASTQKMDDGSVVISFEDTMKRLKDEENFPEYDDPRQSRPRGRGRYGAWDQWEQYPQRRKSSRENQLNRRTLPLDNRFYYRPFSRNRYSEDRFLPMEHRQKLNRHIMTDAERLGYYKWPYRSTLRKTLGTKWLFPTKNSTSLPKKKPSPPSALRDIFTVPSTSTTKPALRRQNNSQSKGKIGRKPSPIWQRLQSIRKLRQRIDHSL